MNQKHKERVLREQALHRRNRQEVQEWKVAHGFQFQTGYKTSKGDKFDSILIDIDQIASAERVITVNNAVQ